MDGLVDMGGLVGGDWFIGGDLVDGLVCRRLIRGRTDGYGDLVSSTYIEKCLAVQDHLCIVSKSILDQVILQRGSSP